MSVFESRVNNYVEEGGTCPFCGNEDVDYGSGDFGSEASQEASCPACESEWRDTYQQTGIHVDRIGDGIDESSGAALGEHKVTQYFLLVLVGDVEPVLQGPFKNDDKRLAAARKYREEEGEEDGLYRLDVCLDGKTDVSPFSGGELAIDEEEE